MCNISRYDHPHRKAHNATTRATRLLQATTHAAQALAAGNCIVSLHALKQILQHLTMPQAVTLPPNCDPPPPLASSLVNNTQSV
jgi:hypothetical protein